MSKDNENEISKKTVEPLNDTELDEATGGREVTLPPPKRKPISGISDVNNTSKPLIRTFQDKGTWA